MIKAIFYKEWIKTRLSVVLIFAVMAAGTIYAFIDTAQNFRVSGAVQVWNAIITKDAPLLPVVMQWLPAMAALLLALSQFLPEMTDKRLKLTLHLPLPEDRILMITLAYGIVSLVTIYVAAYIALTVGLSAYYPAEMVGGMYWKSLPWFLAGLCTYLLTAWICLEPVWRHKIMNSLAAVCLCCFFFIGAPSKAYMLFLPYLGVFTLLCFAFPFYSTARFKEGAQR